MKKNAYILCTVLAALCMMACSGKEKKQNTDVLKVTTETVCLSSDAAPASYVGVVEEGTSVAVSFTGMGMIRQVHVSEGQAVRKGQLLAEMDKTQAENALAMAQATHKQATDALERMRKLHENKSLADMKWVEVQSKVKQAEASLSAARKMLEDCSIHAPIDGVVGKKSLSTGETALPSQPVVSILSIRKLKVKVSIPEREIAVISPSTPSSLTIEALNGKQVSGGAIEKGVVADAATHTYDIRINIDNPDGDILPGMVAKVALSGQTGQQGMYLPIRAVQQSAGGNLFVWTMADGKAHRSNVSVGETVGDRIQILSGLSEGDLGRMGEAPGERTKLSYRSAYSSPVFRSFTVTVLFFVSMATASLNMRTSILKRVLKLSGVCSVRFDFSAISPPI